MMSALVMLLASGLGSAMAAEQAVEVPACAPTTGGSVVVLRDHRYEPIGACGAVRVLRTASTDSTFLDRAAATTPVILVTGESVEPTAAGEGWPAPVGNLYLSVVVPGTPETGRARLESALDGWRAAHAPAVVWTVGWDGNYGAHRAADTRFVSGLVVEAHAAGVALGLDLHIGATQAAYDQLGSTGQHATFVELAGRDFPLDSVLWDLLNRLWSPPATPLTPPATSPHGTPPT